MGKFDEAEQLLGKSHADAESKDSWYMQIYGYLAFASLRTKMGRLDDAKRYVDRARSITETSGTLSRFSWLISYCAYRAGDIATRQGRVQDAM